MSTEDREYERDTYTAELTEKGLLALTNGKDFEYELDGGEVTIYFSSILTDLLGEIENEDLCLLMFGLMNGTSDARNKLKRLVMAEIEKTLEIYLKWKY